MPRLPRSRAARIALAWLAAVLVLACTFDWNWCAPWVRHYIESRSGRSMRFDRMDVRFEHGLDPTIEFRNLAIQNAPWAASSAPFIRAARAAGNVSWRSLGSELLVVNRIELEDAQVDMERRADGLRNWRLTRPDDRGPPRVRVLSLDARRSSLHLVHRGIDLELDARTTPLPSTSTLPAHPELPLTRRLEFQGRYRGHDFGGDSAVSDVLTFGATPRMFALRGNAHLGALKLAASGLSNDVHALGELDLDATLSTPGGGAAWPLPDMLQRVGPLVVRGHVTRSGTHPADAGPRGHSVLADGVLDLRDIDAALAGGHVTGNAHLDASRPPAQVTLALAAQGLRIAQLSPALAAKGALAGSLQGRADLKTRGDTPAALAANANGRIALALAPGASVSRRLDARLGLDGGEWLRSLFDPSARVPVRCAAVTLALANGVATSQGFVFETPATTLAGHGWFNLRERTLDLTLTPRHSQPALLSLDKSIHAQGAWHDVKISLVPAGADQPARCELRR